MDFSKLSMGLKIALIGGAVLIINLFMPWYSIDFGIASVSIKAFDAEIYAWGGSLLAIAGAAVLALKAMNKQEMSAGKFKTEQLAFLLGAAGFVLIVLRLVTESTGAAFGLYLGIVASAAVAYGAFTEMKAKGMKMPGMS